MPSSRTLTTSPLHTLFNAFHRFRTELAGHRRTKAAYNRTFYELAGMSNRELGDIGLCRADIPRIAAEAAALQ